MPDGGRFRYLGVVNSDTHPTIIMKRTFPSVLTAALLLLGMFASGCSSIKAPAAGALAHPEQLRPVDPRGTLAYRRQDNRRLVFRAVDIAPVEITAEAVSAAKLTPAAVAALAAELHAELSAVLGRRFRLEAAPARGALSVRAIVTAVDVSNPTVNTFGVLAVGMPVDAGGIAVVLDARDAATGERIAARAQSRAGRPYQILAGLRRTGQARAGFRAIAEAFAEDLAFAVDPAVTPPKG